MIRMKSRSQSCPQDPEVCFLVAKVSDCGIQSEKQPFGSMRMESYHWFLLGIMVAFTPSLLVLGVLLARSTDHPADTNNPND
jgi:hypothetical protein